MTDVVLRQVESLACGQCWALLERVASSAHIKRATRLQELLFYVGRLSLKEGRNEVHEQEIGCTVFGRPAGYDTSIDNIVRTNVSDLRKRIEAYFAAEGLHEDLIMEIPRGSYIPVFRNRAAEPEPGFNSKPIEEQPAAAARLMEPPAAAAEAARPSTRGRWLLAAGVLAVLVIVALGIVCAVLWNRVNAMNRAFYAWQYQPAVAAFWTPFLDASANTDVVTPDNSFSIIESIARRDFSFNEYLNRTYVGQLQAMNLSPDTRTAVSLIAARDYGSPAGFNVAQRILALDPLGKRIHQYYGRDYMPALVTRDNVILIGARIANPWDELFESRMNFVAETRDSFTTIVNRAPRAGEQPVYSRTDSVGYCEVAYLPSPSSSGRVLLLEGTSAEATEAAGNFLLSEAQMAGFQKMLRVTKFPYFEALLKISAVRGTPLTVTVETYRAYPQLH